MMMNKIKEEGRSKKQEASSFLLPSSYETLRRAIEVLNGTDTPRLTAEVLLAHILGVSRTRLLSRPEQPIAPEALAEYNRLLARAATGEPLAYLTGHREFYGLDFLVDSCVLVPRPETELIIDLALSSNPLSILDIGTGSGCLAITLAKQIPSAHVTAVDISPDALAVARLNAQHHSVADRLTFVESDLLSSVVRPPSPVALLVTNLPYIASDELRQLPVSKHEPALALDGGPDGLALIRRLLADAPRLMAPNGRLLLEIGSTQGQAAAALARAAFPTAEAVGVHPDLAGLDRVVEIAL